VSAVLTGNTYDKYATKNPIERRLMANFMVKLDSLLPVGDLGRVLEVGTGEGHVAAHIRGRYPAASVLGIDLPDEGLANQWRAGGLMAAFASGEQLPFPDSSFDLVLAVEVLEHVKRPDVVLAEISRVARKAVVVTVPNEPIWRIANMARGKYLAQLGNTPGHIQHWSRRSFTNMVGGHLEVMSSQGSFPWTLVGAQA
jgi:SAM-dependent methyltransferase